VEFLHAHAAPCAHRSQAIVSLGEVIWERARRDKPKRKQECLRLLVSFSDLLCEFSLLSLAHPKQMKWIEVLSQHSPMKSLIRIIWDEDTIIRGIRIWKVHL
jgi:hypothetical protein